MSWYLAAMRKYADFTGRAHRKEYWMFVLFNCIIFFALGVVAGLGPDTSVISVIYYIGILIPAFAVCVRRLHDTNRSGWWIFVGLIPLIGPFVLLVFLVEDGQWGENQYGPNPKWATASVNRCYPTAR